MVLFESILKWGQFFLTLFLLGYPLHFVVGRLTCSRKWWGALGAALFIPGATIHELGHATACLVTGQKIIGTNFGFNPKKGGHVLFLNTGLRTPLVLHAIAYAPVVSCGIVVAGILHYITLHSMYFELQDWGVWLFLLLSVAAGAAPSTADAKMAMHSLGDRPRVTVIEVVSFGGPLLLVELSGLASDAALLTYIIVVVATYALLWKALILPEKEATKGLVPLPGDGRERASPKKYGGNKSSPLPAMPPLPVYGIRDLPLSVPSAEEIYRLAGLKIKGKRGKRPVEGSTLA